MNKELFEAIVILEKEKNISREVLIEAIERSLIQACKIHFGKSDNIKAEVNRETCDFSVVRVLKSKNMSLGNPVAL